MSKPRKGEFGWLKELHLEEERERASKRRSETRGTRLRPDEAEELDRRAAAAGVTPSTYIRLICTGPHPDLAPAQEQLRRARDLVMRFCKAHEDTPASAEEVQALRRAVFEICKGGS